jgi:cell division cycle protein 20 (cofactor of APC complex)
MDQQQQNRTMKRSNSIHDTQLYSDRFIPNRSIDETTTLNQQLHYTCSLQNNSTDDAMEDDTSSIDISDVYNTSLHEYMFQRSISDKVLALSDKPPVASYSKLYNPRNIYTRNRTSRNSIRNNQNMSQNVAELQRPEKILDAPDLLDDFYCNTIQWGENNLICVALGAKLFIWNAENGSIFSLMECTQPDQYISSVAFGACGQYLAIGTSYNDIQIWDVKAQKKLRVLRDHSSRVNCLSWNFHELSSGGQNGLIAMNDLRIAESTIHKFIGHADAICNLKWSPSGSQLASGGNDNKLCIWEYNNLSQHRTLPLYSIREHHGAIKAMDWCPWKDKVLAVGGGLTDKRLAMWNTSTGRMTNSIDTGNQICSLKFSKIRREIVTAYGFPQGGLSVWSYPQLHPVKQLYGHDNHRVLYLEQSPDGTSFCSAGADQAMNFWRLYNSSTSSKLDESSIAENSDLQLRSIR